VTAERRVKIVTTLGPAVAGKERLVDLIGAGADMVRINAAHGSEDDRTRLIEDVRGAADEIGKAVPILFDLRGLKIRTGPLADGAPVPFARGSDVTIVAEPEATREGLIGINFPNLFSVIKPGSRILIADGLIELMVDRINGASAVCKVGRGGILHGKQGVTLPGAPITGGSLTPDDRIDVAFAVRNGVDYLGLSFINDASDLVLAKGVAGAHGHDVPGLIAKIERPEALNNVYEIASHADGLMVARGDLGVQLPPERVPRAQKHIIGTCNTLGVPVITATQMLESMITQPMATRAETSDVANAVWDGTDAVMLSAESAVGQYPIEAVQTMARIIVEAEREGPIRTAASADPLPTHGDETLALADALAQAAWALADHAPIEQILVFTLTGAAARRIAKYRPKPPIIAVTSDLTTARRLAMVWGMQTVIVPVVEDPDTMFRTAGQAIIDAGLAKADSNSLIVGSLPMMRVAGRTNLIHMRRLGT
jgi:pyruvate kinase